MLIAAVAVLLSTALSSATHLIFHLHPIAIGVLGAWLYRRVLAARPCATHAATFLIGLAVLVSAGAEALAPAGLVDPPWVAGALDLLGILAGGWILLRRPSRPTAAAPGGRVIVAPAALTSPRPMIPPPALHSYAAIAG